MPAATALPAIIENRIVTGLLPGFSCPVAVVKIRFPATGPDTTRLQTIDRLLAQFLPGYTRQWQGGSFTQDDLNNWLVLVLDLLHEHTLAPRPGKGRAELLAAESEQSIMVCVLYPVLGPQHGAVNFALHILIGLFHEAEVRLTPACNKGLNLVMERFRNQSPSPVGLAHFLKAAEQAGIPWQHVSNNVYQYGWGRKARLLDGTFTDRTPNIASRICLHKPVLHQVLHGAGIPVPEQMAISSASQALQAAQKLGYPVVIKPADKDRGEGVSTNLQTPEAVQQALQRATAKSTKILMEKHCPGDDYRVYVVNGEVLHVVRRHPGRVTGNATDTVRQLLATLNAEPVRQPAAGRRKQIKLNSEALELLQDQGLTADSIIPDGQIVVLRRTPNISTGGDATEVPLSDIHPDNLALFIRTARLLNLDIAGIDFLSIDISRSWLANGAVICEVNAQPQHPPKLAEAMLARLVEGNGRIPVVVVVENREHTGWLDKVLTTLHNLKITTGIARADRLELDRSVIVKGRFDAPYAAQQLLRDTAVACLFIQINDVAMLDNGLPVDNIDLLVLSGITGYPANLPALAIELSSRSRHALIDTDSPLWKKEQALFLQPERCSEQQLHDRVLACLGLQASILPA